MTKCSAKSSGVTLIAVIGDGWFAARDDEGNARLADPDDWLVREIETALDGAKVIPVLVEGAKIPKDSQLPPSLKQLAQLHAETLGYKTFETDVERLVGQLAPAAAGVIVRPPGVTKPGESGGGFPRDFVDDLRDEAAYVEIPAGRYQIGVRGRPTFYEGRC